MKSTNGTLVYARQHKHKHGLTQPQQSAIDLPALPGKTVTSSAQAACTPACTSEVKSEQTDPVAALAAALLSLSPEDRARLAAMLTGQGEGNDRT